MQEAWIFFSEISTSEEEVITLSRNIASRVSCPVTWRHTPKERTSIFVLQADKQGFENNRYVYQPTECP
jgi:hypothetical protein